MHTRIRYPLLLFFLSVLLFSVSATTSVYAYPYCSKGMCVEGFTPGTCFPEGCMSSCVQDCYPDNCDTSDFCGDKKYYQSAECCTAGSVDWGGTCTQDCDCTESCCDPSTTCSCSSPYTNSSTSYGSFGISCGDGCGGTAYDNCYCQSNCTPPSCPDGTSGTASTPVSPMYSVPSGSSDYYSSPSCTNYCNKSNDRDCYCDICLPPTCEEVNYFSAKQYDDLNDYQGEVPYGKTASCTNGEGLPVANQTANCSKTYRTCYCTSCLKICPLGLYNTSQSLSPLPNLILESFRECTNDCAVKPDESIDDCYEAPSPQPEESFSIVTDDPPPDPNEYDFLSLTHTGDRLSLGSKVGNLNDPLLPIKMEAKYTDSNGASDVEGMFVWFREKEYDGTTLNSPIYINTGKTPQAPTNNSWGFMLRRVGADWVPYVPSFRPSNPNLEPHWTPAALEDPATYFKKFYIAGSNGNRMVQVTILEDPVIGLNDVTMTFSLAFSNSDGSLFPDSVGEGDYNILLLGLDKFSFTPYDNYPPSGAGWNFADYWSTGYLYDSYTDFSPFWKSDQLRYRATPTPAQTYARAWKDTGENWVIDRTPPVIDNFVVEKADVEGNKLKIKWQVHDNIQSNNPGNLYTVVGNIFSSSGSLARQITLSPKDLGISVKEPFVPEGVSDDVIGLINVYWSFRVNPNINSGTNTGTIEVDIGENTSGIFSFYLTVFDDAGNTTHSSQVKFNLADWFATAGGLAYSEVGSLFSTKEDVAFDDLFPPYTTSVNPGLTQDTADSSSELWGTLTDTLSAPVKSLSSSYNITNYRGNGLNLGYYFTLMKAYEQNKSKIEDQLYEQTFDPPSSLYSLACGLNKYCALHYMSDLTVNSNFVCDKPTLITVKGNLTLNPPILSTSLDAIHSSNGCIFLVEGDVSINPGGQVSDNTNLGYDKVHAYILADGQITIEGEDTNATIMDGLYINGGLNSSYTSDLSIKVDRYLWLKQRLDFPVLAIDYHPKYGVLGGIFFGYDYVMQPVEVGPKP